VRIVSLLPSTTEILFAIGAGDDVAGVTFECDFPPEARARRVVSNTALPEGLTAAEIDAEVSKRMAAGEDIYRLEEDALRDIDPELILTQDLCAVCAVDVSNVEGALDHLGCRARVLTVDPSSLDEVIESIATIGAATGHDDEASELTSSLRARLARVADAVGGAQVAPRVAMLEWTDPPFNAGHWVPDLVTGAGGTEVLGRPGVPSVRVEWQAIEAAAPDIVVVAPCGYRLDGARRLAQALVADGRLPASAAVWAIDADAVVVRPGPRVVDGVEAIAGIVHPDLAPGRPELVTRVR